MPKITILKKLIPHYKNVIEEIKVKPHTYEEILSRTKTGQGICWCASTYFKVDIYDEEWVHKNIKIRTANWTKTPNNALIAEEAISLLQYRVDTMEKILEQAKKQNDARRKAKAKGAK